MPRLSEFERSFDSTKPDLFGILFPMTGRANNVVEDWTYGPARWLGAGLLAGAALVGIVWSVSARRVEAENPPAMTQSESRVSTKHPAKNESKSESTPTAKAIHQPVAEPDLPKPAASGAVPIITQLAPRPEEAQPTVAAQPESKSVAAPSAPSSKVININAAKPEELEKLPGIGPSLAARIVEDRAKNGRFKKIDDLDRVKGIGPKLLEKIRPFAAVE